MSQVVVQLRFQAPQGRTGIVSAVRQHILAAYRDSVTRRRLSSLDARELSDIGISHAQAQFEAERPVWELVPFLHR